VLTQSTPRFKHKLTPNEISEYHSKGQCYFGHNFCFLYHDCPQKKSKRCAYS